MFACLYAPPAPVCHPLAPSGARAALQAIAQAFVPRFEVPTDEDVLLDIRGLGRILGEPRQIGAELRRAAADRGLRAHVAIAGTRTAARLLAHARAGLTCVEPGGEAAALAPLPIELLQIALRDNGQPFLSACGAPPPHARARRLGSASLPSSASRGPQALAVFRRWGIATLGDLAALPAPALFERLGADGPAWQRLARGEDPAQPMTPWTEEIPFHVSMELEWPIEGLEPLSFVLGRLLDPLAADLERRDRAAAVLHLHLGLVTRAVFTRTLRLPAPIRDPRVLRTLLRLDLDTHPPDAAIETVAIDVEPAPGRIVQESLLERARPAPEQITTLLARLRALLGEDRCGAPALVDSHRPGAFAMAPFSAERAPAPASDGSRKPGWERLRPCRAEDLEIRGEASAKSPGGGGAPPALKNIGRSQPATRLPGVLRRFRRPIPVRVRVEHGAPAQVIVDRAELAGGRVERCAGPWRTSGEWWAQSAPDSEQRRAPRAREGAERGDGAPASDRAGVWGGAPWNQDQWDVALSDGIVCRLSHDRETKRWFIDAVVD
jgi:protein ImuB